MRVVQSFVGVVLWSVSRVDDVAFWRVGDSRRVGTDARRRSRKRRRWFDCDDSEKDEESKVGCYKRRETKE